MIKNNFNLDYYNKYDFVQKYLSSSVYASGKVKKVSVTFLGLSSMERSLNMQAKLFLYTYILNHLFPLVQRHIKTLNKSEESQEKFYLSYSFTNQDEVLSFLKYLSLELISNDLSKNLKFICNPGSSVVRIKTSLDNLIALQDIYAQIPIEAKDIVVYFELHLDKVIQTKKELKNVFPFWTND